MARKDNWSRSNIADYFSYVLFVLLFLMDVIAVHFLLTALSISMGWQGPWTRLIPVTPPLKAEAKEALKDFVHVCLLRSLL